jgi:hypothetical protein
LTLSGINPDGEIDDLSKSLFRVEIKMILVQFINHAI